MNRLSQKGLSPVMTIVFVALVLVIGVGAASAVYIKNKNDKEKAQTELKSTSETDKIDSVEQTANGKLKFELEGTLASVNPTTRVITVKIKSSSDSIAALRGAEQEIAVAMDAELVARENKNPTLADFLIGDKVNVGGAIKDSGKLVASKVISQKVSSSIEESKSEFEFHGLVKGADSSSVIVLVQATNELTKDKRGQEVIVKTTASTIVKRNGKNVNISQLVVDDKVEMKGTISGSDYLAAQIEAESKDDSSENNNKSSPEPSESESANNNENNSNNSDSQKTEIKDAEGVVQQSGSQYQLIKEGRFMYTLTGTTVNLANYLGQTVKIKGPVSGSTMTVTEIELKD